MTPRKRLLSAMCLIMIAGVASWLVGAFVAGTPPFRAKVDPQTRTSGLLVETDAGTGCQYIVTPWGGIVARTGPDGRQLCGPQRP